MNNLEVRKRIGDFYEAHSYGDIYKLKEALFDLQKYIDETGDSSVFFEFFNEPFAGRTAYNINLDINDYPEESIFKELLQNAFGCTYEKDNKNKEMSIKFEFLDALNEISLWYNEDGFKLEDILYFLSFGRNNGDTKREGRFGIGAKSVLANVDEFLLDSNSFHIKVVRKKNSEKINLSIEEFELNGKRMHDGTTIKIITSADEYRAIKENLLKLTEEKGKYINIPEFCFSYLRKTDEIDKVKIILNINEKTEKEYLVHSEEDICTFEDVYSKELVNFACYSSDGFTYLIPLELTKKSKIINVLQATYDYFSTYELTGKLLQEEYSTTISEKLSSFFISIPNDYITKYRTGISAKYESLVSNFVLKHIKEIIDKYKEYFELIIEKNGWFYWKYYIAEYIYNYLNKSRFTNQKILFSDYIKLNFNNECTIQLKTIKIHSYLYEGKYWLNKREHEDRTEYYKLRSKVNEKVPDYDYIICAKYKWQNSQKKNEKGEQFCYKCVINRKIYEFDCHDDKKISKFFKLFNKIEFDIMTNNKAIYTDKQLIECIDIFRGDIEFYYINDENINLLFKDTNQELEVSIVNLSIESLKKDLLTIEKNKSKFINSSCTEFETYLVEKYCGQDLYNGLCKLKESEIELDASETLMINAFLKKLEWPYERIEIMLPEYLSKIPDNLTCDQGYKLFGEQFLKNFEGRILAPKKKINLVNDYKINVDDLYSLLSKLNPVNSNYHHVIDNLYFSDIKIDNLIAIVNSEFKVMRLVKLDEKYEIDEKDNYKFIILNKNIRRSTIAKYIEFLITGKNNDILKNFYSSAQKSKEILLDQLPYYYKPVPNIKVNEFEYLLEETKKCINPIESKRIYNKDINNRLFGYGNCCPLCGYDSECTNPYMVKELKYRLERKTYIITLYLCANDYYQYDGAIIFSITIGGLSLPEWIDMINKKLENKSDIIISSNMLKCEMIYKNKISFDFFDIEKNEDNKENETNGREDEADIKNDSISESNIVPFTLSPLIAAKWYNDNSMI